MIRALHRLEQLRRIHHLLKWLIGVPAWIAILAAVVAVWEVGCGMIEGGH